MTGPMLGPMNVIMENNAMAFPRSTGPHMSTSTPGALDSGEAANVPVRKRPINKAAKLLANAQRKLKIKYRVNEM